MADAQSHRLSKQIRSRVRVGQSMPEVLTAAEDALTAQGPRVTPPYFINAHCGKRFWTLLRESQPDVGVAFRLSGGYLNLDGPLPPSQAPVFHAVASKTEALGFVEAQGRGCIVSVDAGKNQLVLTVDDNGRVATIAPP